MNNKLRKVTFTRKSGLVETWLLGHLRHLRAALHQKPPPKKPEFTWRQPPEWECFYHGSGIQVRAWTIGEARAALKKFLDINGRLPVGVKVRLIGGWKTERQAA